MSSNMNPDNTNSPQGNPGPSGNQTDRSQTNPNPFAKGTENEGSQTNPSPFGKGKEKEGSQTTTDPNETGPRPSRNWAEEVGESSRQDDLVAVNPLRRGLVRSSWNPTNLDGHKGNPGPRKNSQLAGKKRRADESSLGPQGPDNETAIKRHRPDTLNVQLHKNGLPCGVVPKKKSEDSANLTSELPSRFGPGFITKTDPWTPERQMLMEAVNKEAAKMSTSGKVINKTRPVIDGARFVDLDSAVLMAQSNADRRAHRPRIQMKQPSAPTNTQPPAQPQPITQQQARTTQTTGRLSDTNDEASRFSPGQKSRVSPLREQATGEASSAKILEALQTIEISADVIRESTNSAKTSNDHLTSTLDELNREHGLAQEEIDSLNETIAAMEEAITKIDGQKLATEKAGEEKRHELESEMAVQNQKMMLLDHEVVRLKAQLRDKTSELATANCDLQSLEMERGDAEQVKADHIDLIDQIEHLEAQHALEIEMLENKLRRVSESQSGPQDMPVPTPLASSSRTRQESDEHNDLAWKKVLDFAESSKSRLVEDEYALNLLRSLKPRVIDESKKHVSYRKVFLNLAKVANNLLNRKLFEEYLDEAPQGWYCIVLVSKYGHKSQGAADSEGECTYPRHSKKCVQVRKGHGARGAIDPRRKMAPEE
ncbi:hypothetical protein Daus18300_000286 [Diaporthe australafricana]|uniref:Uncharacterized protein n=1 Tax=Diaporthe australafricana TaxID=127596 RepID=A0ABR3Y5Y3_9PEZI